MNIFSAFTSIRFWFNFLVMNVWQFDIGTAIWYVQALLYAYIIIYFLDKRKLLKYDWIIAAVLILLTVCTGELAGIFKWNVAGYTYLTGNFLTRALPYVLLGAFLHRNMKTFGAVRRMWYYCAIGGGIILTIAEPIILSIIGAPVYYGHLLGYGVIAFSVCMLAIKGSNNPGFESTLKMSRWHTNCIYYFCQPVSVLVVFILSIDTEIIINLIKFVGIIVFIISFGLALLVAYIGRLIAYIERKYFKKKQMDKRIKLAGIPIEIHTLFDSLPNAADYETDEKPIFSVCITEQDIVSEQNKSMAECAYEGIPYPNYSPAELENTAIYRKIAAKLPEYDGLVFHGSAVAVGEKAYLFTAKSGTGKTTHTNLWLKNIKGSFVINGDKPIPRIIDGKPFVCGTPWMGKEGYGCNKTVPLSAICFLNRGTENRIEKAAFQKSYPHLLGQCYRPENGLLVVKTVKLLEKIGRCVPIYELFCNMEDEAAFVAFGGMSDDKI